MASPITRLSALSWVADMPCAATTKRPAWSRCTPTGLPAAARLVVWEPVAMQASFVCSLAPSIADFVYCV